MTNEELKLAFRSVKDFPRKGVIFKDLTTVVKQPDYVSYIVDCLYEQYKDCGITTVVGIESRGFIFAPIMAYKLNVGFVPMRKKSKLPGEVYQQEYKKEYGTDTLTVHKDALNKDDVVLLHDDFLATGGTLEAACKLLKKIGVRKIYINVLSEITDFNARENLKNYGEVESLIKF